MKQLWTEPVVEVEIFLVESVMTASSNDGDYESENPGYEGPSISI